MTDLSRRDFEQVLTEVRPMLHRYCARMIGSVIDGEDVVQEAMLKAIEAPPESPSIENPRGWLFRIAHNAALDYLRRRARYDAAHSSEDMTMIADPVDTLQDRQVAAASLRTFMQLPVNQRSTVILRDVLGHSLPEIVDIVGGSVPSVKSALQHGRKRLRALALEPEEVTVPVLTESESARLKSYVERFNARDFDAIRSMLADDVRLELVNRLEAKGPRAVENYFHNYTVVDDWQFVPGFVDRRPAILVCNPNDLQGRPAYFVLLSWRGDGVAGIRDFRFARYAIEAAELHVPRAQQIPSTDR